MRINQLRLNVWYMFTNFEEINSCCKYIGLDFTWDPYSKKCIHMFRFLEGDKYPYSAATVKGMKLCSRSFSKYLDLFCVNK